MFSEYETDTLILYHIFPTFNDPDKEDFRKHCGKRRKCWEPAISPFPTMFSEYETDTLILHHIFPTFNDPDKEDFRKHCGKRRKC